MTAGWSVATDASGSVLRVCLLCGHEAAEPEVAWGLMRFRQGDPFGSGPHCKDRSACRQRCLDNGEPWLVDDGQPETRRPASVADWLDEELGS